MPESTVRPAADERRLRQAARQLLFECRREIREELGAPVPDPTALLELRVQERLLQERLAPACHGKGCEL